MIAPPPIVGIIGGFGPDTSAAFCARLVRHAQEMQPSIPPAFVADFVSVSPAIAQEAIGGSREAGARLAGAIRESVGRLHRLGVRTIALPCNTMHLFADAFGVPPEVGFLHIVDAVIEELKQTNTSCVGLIATQLTVSSRLYADRLERAGIRCATPSAGLQRRLASHIGRFVETGTVLPDTAAVFRGVFEEFERDGVAQAVLGCTDLSGMMERCSLQSAMPCLDSMDVLAKACARLCV